MADPKSNQSIGFVAWLATRNGATPHQPAIVPPISENCPVLVVGAGPAGLTTMAALREAGVPFEGVESHTGVGGIWDESNPISSVYSGLNMVTSRLTSYIGAPMPEEWPFYPERKQAHEYFITFANSHDLPARIRFATRFEDAAKTSRGTWNVRLKRVDRGESIEREYAAIVFATGAYNKEHRRFPSELLAQAEAAGLHAIHSADYRTPEPFAGKNVLVVGIGNSGSDIADKISPVARRTLLSIRTTPWINPLTLGGVPCDKLAEDPSRLPEWLGLWLFQVGRRLSIGSYRRLGMKRPDFGLNDRTPMSDRGIVAAIRSKRVVARSNLVSLDEGLAQFADSEHEAEKVDAVIFATGFHRKYPLLPPANSSDEQLLFFLFHRNEPGLAYLTELIGSRSCWPIFMEQGRAIAAYFAAVQRHRERWSEFHARRSIPSPVFKGNLFRLADEYHIDYRLYTRFLREFVDWMAE